MNSSPANETKLSKTLVGIAGEYFVAGELSRRGLIAAVTLRNTRGIDILVVASGRSDIGNYPSENTSRSQPLMDAEQKR
jgi:hypothetical protein